MWSCDTKNATKTPLIDAIQTRQIILVESWVLATQGSDAFTRNHWTSSMRMHCTDASQCTEQYRFATQTSNTSAQSLSWRYVFEFPAHSCPSVYERAKVNELAKQIVRSINSVILRRSEQGIDAVDHRVRVKVVRHQTACSLLATLKCGRHRSTTHDASLCSSIYCANGWQCWRQEDSNYITGGLEQAVRVRTKTVRIETTLKSSNLTLTGGSRHS